MSQLHYLSHIAFISSEPGARFSETKCCLGKHIHQKNRTAIIIIRKTFNKRFTNVTVKWIVSYGALFSIVLIDNLYSWYSLAFVCSIVAFTFLFTSFHWRSFPFFQISRFWHKIYQNLSIFTWLLSKRLLHVYVLLLVILRRTSVFRQLLYILITSHVRWLFDTMADK